MIPSPQYRFLRHSLRDGRSIKHDSSRWAKLHLDPWLLSFLVLNSILGLMVVYSATLQDSSMVIRQATSFGVGFILMFLCAQVPPKVYQAVSPYFYMLGMVLLVLVLVIGDTRLGAKRWLTVPGIGSMQPSEIMKFAMPLMMAWYFSRRVFPPTFLQIVTGLILMMIPFVLVALQPDLNIGLIIPGVFVLFLCGMSWRLILGALTALAVAAPVLWMFVLQTYQKKRILTLFDPESDALGAGWNIIQSKIAIGSGGMFGKGYLNGTQTKLKYVPEQDTDFIFCTVGEEWGFLGSSVLLFIYLWLLLRIIRIAERQNEVFNRVYGYSVASIFFFHLTINVGMVLGLVPVIGIPLPFLSYGGSSLWSFTVLLFILLRLDAARLQRGVQR